MAQERHVRALLALCLLAGCGTASSLRGSSDVEFDDAVADAVVPPDTPNAGALDAAVAADSASAPEVREEPDAAAPPLDAASAPDVVEPVDAMMEVDVKPPRDVARVDASRTPETSPDVVTPPDVGVAPDVRTLPDAATIRDAGVVDVPRVDAVAAPDVPRVDAARPMDVVDVGVPDPGPAVPPWDQATTAHVRDVRARGAARGNRVGVFAKIGDSITESGSFMNDIGSGWYDLGAYQYLETTVRFFRATSLGGDDVNAFNRASACATAGWTTDDALAGGTNSPLQQELTAARAAWAIVMYGTNDIDRSDLGTYRVNLLRIIDVIEAAGTVPAVSTIPDRSDGAGPAARALQFNAVVRDVAASRHIPLIDYWLALQTLPAHGVSTDGIHPNVYLVGGSTASADFSPAGLRYGYNVRNLTALQMLDRLRALP